MKTNSKERIAQMQLLVSIASNSLTLDFGKINTLRNNLKSLKSQLAYVGTAEDIKAANIMLSVLPKPHSVKEKIAHQEWLEFQLWQFGVLAKQMPSKSVKHQMDKIKALFMSKANFVQREEFLNAYSAVESL